MWNDKKKSEALSSVMNFDQGSCQSCGTEVGEDELDTDLVRLNWKYKRFCQTCQVVYLNVDLGNTKPAEELIAEEKAFQERMNTEGIIPED